jgi:hypothetical protein
MVGEISQLRQQKSCYHVEGGGTFPVRGEGGGHLL